LLANLYKHVYSPLGRKRAKKKQSNKNTVKHIQGQQSQALHILESTNHKHMKNSKQS